MREHEAWGRGPAPVAGDKRLFAPYGRVIAVIGDTVHLDGDAGPRRERVFNWPVGVESMRGGSWSPFDGTAWSGDAPHYGRLEIGLGTQLLIIGADLGVDIYQALDFITGIVTVDLEGDDI